MAKITKWNYMVKNTSLEFGVYYTTGKGFFLKGIPSEVVELTGEWFSGYKTEGDLKEALYRAMAKYHKKIEKSRKVIAFNISMTTKLAMNNTGQGSYTGFKNWVPDIFKNTDLGYSGNGFSIRWQILLETLSEKIKYNSINDDESIGHQTKLNKDRTQIIDWTPEREQMFKDIDSSLEKMVSKFSSVLSDKQALIDMVATGKKLLE